jgi:hypothetical protein
MTKLTPVPVISFFAPIGYKIFGEELIRLLVEPILACFA